MKSFIITEAGVALYMDGKSYSADQTHPRFNQIIEAIRSEEWDNIPDLISVAAAVQAYATGTSVTVDVENGIIYHNGEMLRGYLIERILNMMACGFNIKPMTSYLEHLLQNPSQRSIDELHGFNEYGRMPITEDGHFIAYKRIRGWHDTYTQKVLNKPAHLLDDNERAMLPYTVNGVTVDLVNGELTVSMPRNQVDSNAESTCSYGLHFCSQEYLKSFSGDKIVVLKINPADVVSIPTDYNNTKGRCCKYQVIDVLSQEDFDRAMTVDVLSTPVYDTGTNALEDWEVDYDDTKLNTYDVVVLLVTEDVAIPGSADNVIEHGFLVGYARGYADGRKKEDHSSQYAGDGAKGYAEGLADGKGHKVKKYK